MSSSLTRFTVIHRVYLIIALFVALIFCLVLLIQVPLDALTGIRAYVGGEGLWAKAQKDAVRSLEHYAASRDEADYLVYLREIQVPLGDRRARIELQKDDPDLAVALAGFVQGRNHPDDLGPAVRLFRRFQRSAYMSTVIGHWTAGDRLIAELNGVAEGLHKEIVSGRSDPEVIRSYLTRLDDINRQLTVEEDLFSSTLADASRWANDVSRNLTYAIAFLSAALGVVLSWPIVTRIRATENALSESEEELRSIFEHVDDIIYTVESDGTFSSISPSAEQMLGWQSDEWIGRPFSLIVHPDDLPLMQELFRDALAGEAMPVFQVRILTKAGGYVESEIVASPIHRGRSIAIIGVVRDITERKRREEEVRRLNEELETKVRERTSQLLESQAELVRKEKLAVLGQVAGSVGHELRNPLGVMSNAVYFLQTVLDDADSSVKDYLDIIKDEIDCSERIVSDLLDSVRTRTPQLEAVAVAELIEQTLSGCTVPPSVTVKLDLPATLPPLRVDAMQISQVFHNLIMNGVEAMPEGGTLEILAAADQAAGSITISVRDSGVGMTPGQLGKLFQPLYTTKVRGIGLGLVVVKNLTQVNAGSVNVESHVGKGSEFSVTLPSDE